jgi:lysophospholipase L1-like esterase
MRKSSNTAPTLRAEGRGGWKLSDYFKPYGDLTITHMQPFSPFMHVSGYTYYGPIEFWKAIVTGTSQYIYGTNGFDDYVSWFDNNGYKVNPSVNDLMYDGTDDKYVYWNGSAWTDFSGTPTFIFDYEKYVSTWNIASPDFVMIMLGVNDWFDGYSDDAAVIWNERMNTVIQSIQTYATLVSKTIIIGICTNTTVIGMPNNNYGQSVELYSRGMFLGRKNTIQTFDNDTYRNQGVYVVDTGACLDPDYGFSVNEIKPFYYYEGTARELYGSNGVHPSEAGYKQLGTCSAGFIQYIRGL